MPSVAGDDDPVRLRKRTQQIFRAVVSVAEMDAGGVDELELGAVGAGIVEPPGKRHRPVLVAEPRKAAVLGSVLLVDELLHRQRVGRRDAVAAG